VAIGGGLDVVEHGDLAVELVADLHAELALAADGLAEAVKLLILLLEDAGVVLVELLVVKGGGLVAVAGRVGRVVAVGAEKAVAGLVGSSGGRGRVAEADRLGGLAGGGGRDGGSVSEVVAELVRVGVREGGGGGGAGEAVELGRQVVELLLQRGEGVGDGFGAAFVAA
jgi:hypothetical protein